jgi:hypothetical protein
MNLNQNELKGFLPSQNLNFANASPEAIQSILEVLEKEIDKSFMEMRFPSLNRALLQLPPTVADLVTR